jgi:hypothetical protein
MKKLLFITLIIFVCFMAIAQEVPDSLKIEKDGWNYYQNDYRLSMKDMFDITSHNDAAWSQLNAARTNYWIASLFSTAGGACLGYPLGYAIYGNKINMTLIYAGCALIAISIPFTVGYYVHLKKGVKIYNQGLQPPAAIKLSFKAGLTGNGFGLAMRF